MMHLKQIELDCNLYERNIILKDPLNESCIKQQYKKGVYKAVGYHLRTPLVILLV